jgi:L-histidine N-alpha-methyltransferase
LREDVRSGLTGTPKTLPPKWFYDKVGSELFEEITRLPEYYPTRSEVEILGNRAGQIADVMQARTLVELGSGSSTKTRILLDALTARGLSQYVAFDVSASALASAGPALADTYPGLKVRGLVADFDRHLELIPRDGAKIIAFLGGTIGNFAPAARRRFLAAIRATMTSGDALLLGTDLVKSPEVLVPAYNDSQGITAAFNKNVLSVINRELGADFDLDAFEHIAVWDAENEWIEMRLQATSEQAINVRALDLHVSFADGEQIRTEISAKFRRERLRAEMAVVQLSEDDWWTDDAGRFALSLWRPQV